MIAYHDKEWGVPLHNDRKLFEFFILDAFQAGLSWSTIINKRKNFEKAFANFDPKKVAAIHPRRLCVEAVKADVDEWLFKRDLAVALLAGGGQQVETKG
jgi:DNA-3-methyladenine glycosylase I